MTMEVFIYGNLAGGCTVDGVQVVSDPAVAAADVTVTTSEQACKVTWSTPDVGKTSSLLDVKALAPQSADAGMTFVSAWYWRMTTQNSEHSAGDGPEFKREEGVLIAPSGKTFCSSTSTVSITLTLAKLVKNMGVVGVFYGLDPFVTDMSHGAVVTADGAQRCTAGDATLSFSFDRPFNVLQRTLDRSSTPTLLLAELSTLFGLAPAALAVLGMMRVNFVKHGIAKKKFEQRLLTLDDAADVNKIVPADGDCA